MAQSVEPPTSAQVMILRFMSSSPESGSVLTARSLESASDSVFPSLSLPHPHSCPVSLCLKKNKTKKKFLIKRKEFHYGKVLSADGYSEQLFMEWSMSNEVWKSTSWGQQDGRWDP